jgi:hypothetical protein
MWGFFLTPDQAITHVPLRMQASTVGCEKEK